MNNEPIRGDAPVPASPNTPQTPAPSGQPPAPDPAYPSYPVSRPAEPWQFSPPPTPRQPVPASSLDGGMTLLVFAAAWCFLHLCWPGYMGLGMFLFTLFFAGIAVGYRLWSGSPIPRGSYVWLGVMLLSAASFPILDNGLLSWLNLLFLMLITVYWVAVLGENRVEPRLGKRLLADLLNHLFIVPFPNFGCFGTVLARSTAKTRLGKNLLIGAVTLLCSFPVLWFVCQELSTVAAGFGELLEQFAEVISLQNILSATTLFAIPTAFYLYGLLYGNQHKRYTGGKKAPGPAPCGGLCPPLGPLPHLRPVFCHRGGGAHHLLPRRGADPLRLLPVRTGGLLRALPGIGGQSSGPLGHLAPAGHLLPAVLRAGTDFL